MEALTENDRFLQENIPQPQTGCCHSKHTRNCCIATAVFGVLFVILGVLVLIAGKGFLEKIFLESMAIKPGSDGLQLWLTPPVQQFMEVYAFHVTNPEAVLAGRKPIVEEKGPYVYMSDTLSDDNMQWRDNTLTYHPRKIYTFQPYLYGGNDPDKDFLNFPNIPYWTGLHKASKKTGIAQNIALGLVRNHGLGTPFINTSVSGLLWGYNDELPCLTIEKPSSCSKASKSSDGFDDGFGDDGFGDDGFSDDGGFMDSGDNFMTDHETTDDAVAQKPIPKFKPPKVSFWEQQVKPKAEFVDCKCEWGLFRDRNVTMRKPVEFFTGVDDISKKGIVNSFDGQKVFNWWKRGSECDRVKGNDGATLPPNLNKDSLVNIFIALMCRTLRLSFEKV